MAGATRPANSTAKMTDPSRQAACRNHPAELASYQFLEDLATAYWSSELLFAAIHLNLFSRLSSPIDQQTLAQAAECQEEELARMLQALAALGLVSGADGRWQNSAAANRYLVPDRPGYLGDFLLYRRYLREPWQSLAARVAGRPLAAEISPQDDYQQRTFYYVRALDQLARLKVREIAAILADYPWQPPLLDIGGGAGAISRGLLAGKPGTATVIDLPEVIAAAHALYPAAHWRQLRTIAADFRTFTFEDSEKFPLVLMANFLHTYEPLSARELLAKAADLVSPGGLILIHDYFPDRSTWPPAKGALYDLNMMLNTYQGSCQPAAVIINWLASCGLQGQVTELASDSSVIIAYRP